MSQIALAVVALMGVVLGVRLLVELMAIYSREKQKQARLEEAVELKSNDELFWEGVAFIDKIAMASRPHSRDLTTSLHMVLVEATAEKDEHPASYQGPCHCNLCLSYGD